MKYQDHRTLLIELILIFVLTYMGANGQSLVPDIDPTQAKTAMLTKTATSVGCGDGWDTTFTSNGANNQVNAVVSDGNGNTYIGGEFSSVQGLPANGIAKWDGTSWSALGSGIIGDIRSIVVSGSNIYVGGDFNSPVSDGLARNVAKWNGTTWTRLNNGLGGGTHIVNSVFIYNNELYATGGYNTADGSPTTGTAKWDGTAWVAVGTGAPMGNHAVVKDGIVYIGTVGVMTWDGTTWSTMSGITGTVKSIAFSGSDMYVGGSPNIGSGSINVAKWNGTAWSSMGSFASGLINTIAFHNGELYVGGSIPSSMFNNIARWNGTSWVGVATGIDGGTSISERVMALASIGSTLYVGGNYTTAGGQGARNIAKYSAGTWTPFSGTGLDSPAVAMAASGTDVYVGGTFASAGSVTANKIAKWNSLTNTWSTLGTGVTGDSTGINAIAVAGDRVYAGGTFTNIGGVSANNIAVWNGTAWSPLGTGVNSSITSIIVRGEDIYVGGSFTTAGGVTANRVAKWNGTAWSGLSSAILPTTVISMDFMGNDLYVGIPTTTIANPAYFSKYDGTTWTQLGADLGDRGVSSVAVVGSDVYVAGGFATINGVTVNRIAKWNGTAWSALGNGLPSPTGQLGGVRLVAAGSDLIAVGDFTVAGGGPADRIARWNGTAWSPLGTGLNANGTSVVSAGGDILVGGTFTLAGCNSSPYFARYRNTVWTGASNPDWHTPGNWGGGSAPPANGSVTISSADAVISSADVILGSLIVTGGRTLTVAAGRTLTVNGTVDLTGGTIAGPGTVIVNGGVNMTNGNIAGLAALTLNGSLSLGGGNIAGVGVVNITDCRTTAISGGSTASFINSPLRRCVDRSGTYRFPVGSNGVYAAVELSNVTGTGTFTVEPKTGAFSGVAAGLPANRLGRWWSTSGMGITQADMVFTYFEPEITGLEPRQKLYSIDGGNAQVLATTLTTTTNRASVTGVTAFSAFTLADGPSLPAELKGRVRAASGKGAVHVVVSLTDQSGNVRYAFANPFGYYHFPNTMTWGTYTVTVQSKRYTFTSNSQSVLFPENSPDVNFTATDH